MGIGDYFHWGSLPLEAVHAAARDPANHVRCPAVREPTGTDPHAWPDSCRRQCATLQGGQPLGSVSLTLPCNNAVICPAVAARMDAACKGSLPAFWWGLQFCIWLSKQTTLR